MIGRQLPRPGTDPCQPSLGRIIPPEQCRASSSTDARTDVYSLGVMLYWMLSGQTPFQGSVIDVITAHLFSEPPVLDGLVPVPPALSELVHQMLHKDPLRRPGMAEVAVRLDQIELQISSTAMSNPLAVQALRTGSRTVSSSSLQHASAALVTAEPAASATSPRLGRPGLLRRGVGLASLVGICGVTLLLLRGRPSGTSLPLESRAAASEPAAAAAAPVPDSSLPTLPETAPPPTPDETPEAAAAAEPTPATVRWDIRSVPSGALVRAADRRVLGQTPLLLDKQRADGSEELTLSLPGYIEQRLQLSLARDDSQKTTLRRQPAPLRRAVRTRVPAPTPASPPAKETHESSPAIEMEE